MKSSLLQDRGERTFVVVFDKGDEVVAGLTAFAAREHLRASQLTAIGAMRDVTLGYFDRDRRDYTRIPLAEQVEVLSLIGIVTLDGSKPKLHAHIVVGQADGTARGTCVSVVENPAADLLELDAGALVPVVFVIEHTVDRIVIDPPPGRSRDRPGADRPQRLRASTFASDSGLKPSCRRAAPLSKYSR